MQEQHPYKITPDQGWDKMLPILDEAMPVKPYRRHYPFLWWSSSLVVVAAVMGFLLLDGEPSSTSLPVTTEIKAIAPITRSNQSVIPVKNSSSVPSSINEEQAKESMANPEYQISTPGQTAPAKQQQTTQFVKTPKSSVNPEKTSPKEKVIPMAMAEEPVVKEQMEPALPNIEEEASFTLEEFYDEEELTTGVVVVNEEKIMRDAEMLEPLPQVTNLSIIGPGSGDQIIPAESGKRKSHTPFIEPTMAISGLAGLHGGLGFSGGAGANLNIARRFSFTTSLGYLAYQPNAIQQGNLESLDANAGYNWIVNYNPAITGNETYVDAENVNNRAGYNAINPLVDKITQWQVSAGVKWKVTPRFFTEGGVQFGFNTQAYSEYPIVDFEHSGSSSPSLKINNALDEYDVIRTSTASLYLGIGYRVGKHVDVFSNWNHGLHHYILNETNNIMAESGDDERTDYIRGLSVGLRYIL